MKVLKKKGTTDLIQYFVAEKISDGLPYTGLLYNTADLIAYFVRDGAAPVQIPLVTQTITGAHTDGGLVEVGASTVPGIIRIDLPDAVCAMGSDSAIVTISGGKRPKAN